MKQISRRKLLILFGINFAAVLYFGSYLYFRLTDTYIHRAGNYGFTSRLGIKRNTNHFIEPATVAEGPQIFAIAAMTAAQTGQSTNLEDPEITALLETTGEQFREQQEHRDRLFHVYRPAAFLESLLWKAVDPDPLGRRKKREI